MPNNSGWQVIIYMPDGSKKVASLEANLDVTSVVSRVSIQDKRIHIRPETKLIAMTGNNKNPARLDASKLTAINANWLEAWTPMLADALAERDILTSPLRLRHWLLQMAAESGLRPDAQEGLYYTTVARLRTVWPSRFNSMPERTVATYTRNAEKLANFVYGGRMGNYSTGDGWRYRGRGLIQLTGRSNYTSYGKSLKINLVENPHLAGEMPHSARIAAYYWHSRGLNTRADANDLTAITRAIRGAADAWSLQQRNSWLERIVSLEPFLLTR